MHLILNAAVSNAPTSDILHFTRPSHKVHMYCCPILGAEKRFCQGVQSFVKLGGDKVALFTTFD